MKKKILVILCAVLCLTVSAQQKKEINGCLGYLNGVKQNLYTDSNLISNNVLSNYQLIFIAEVHGFKANYDVAYKLIKELKQKTDFRYLLGEMSFANAKRINEYLDSGDTLDLKDIMNNFKTAPSWCKEKYEFYKQIAELNKEYENKMEFLGVDITAAGMIQSLLYAKEIMQGYGLIDVKLDSIIQNPRMSESNLSYILNLHENSSQHSFSNDDEFKYQYVLKNILNYEKARKAKNWDAVRDSLIFENYKKLEAFYHLEKELMIGVWGTGHGYQESSGSVNWFAARLKNELHKSVFTYMCFYFNSKSMTPSWWVPGPLRVFRSKKKLYYNVSYSNDNKPWAVGKKVGVNDLKKASEAKTVSLFDLSKQHSPYRNNQNLVFKPKGKSVTIDYFQAAIVIRNSNATTPFGANKR